MGVTIAGGAVARGHGEVIGDLPEFYTAGWLLAHGRAGEIYDLPRFFAAERALFPSLTRGVALFSPPTAALLLAPLAALPVGGASAFWTTALVAALAASIALLRAHFELDRVETLVVVGLVLLAGPTLEALRIGQPSPLLLLAACAALRLGDRRAAGAAIAAAFAFKPQHLLPLVVYAGAARWRRLVGAAALVLLALVASAALVFGAGGLAHWASWVLDARQLPLMQPELNPTVRGQLVRILGAGRAGTMGIASAFAVGALFVSAWLARRERAPSGLASFLAAAAPLGIVTSLHCHDYDLVLLVPGLVAVARSQAWRRWSAWSKAALAVGLAPFLAPLYHWIHYRHLLGGGVVNPHFVLLAALSIALLGAAYRDPEAFSTVPRR